MNRNSMQLLKHIFANPYLLDEGSVISLSTFLFEGSPGMGTALLGDAPGTAWRAVRLPFLAQDGAVGEAE